MNEMSLDAHTNSNECETYRVNDDRHETNSIFSEAYQINCLPFRKYGYEYYQRGQWSHMHNASHEY